MVTRQVDLLLDDEELVDRVLAVRPTEFGMMAKVQEAEGRVVTDIGLVPDKADAPLLIA